ncbi:OmpH family outer membrane protein [Candidatus Ozemobacteraceae bacterium]|nr:OmpH family outer membrane protein [Candidatus Ozemobacteraceae bacterium]
MKRCLAFFVSIILLACTYPCYGSEAKTKTAKINLGIAASLHPKMSLFDFQNLGFFKVPLGLSKEAFEEAVARTAAGTSSQVLHKRLEELEVELSEITRKKQVLFQSSANAEPGNDTARPQLAALDDQARQLRIERSEAEFAIEHPELTPPSETRSILKDIDSEVMEAVRGVATENGYDVVLNSTFPVPFGYPLTYRTGKEFGRGVSGLEQQVFYALTANHDDLDQQETKEDRFSIWLQLTGHPETQRFLPIQPWPLVVHGGESITPDVVRNIYMRHKISPEIIDIVVSVIEEFESSPPPIPGEK